MLVEKVHTAYKTDREAERQRDRETETEMELHAQCTGMHSGRGWELGLWNSHALPVTPEGRKQQEVTSLRPPCFTECLQSRLRNLGRP